MSWAPLTPLLIPLQRVIGEPGANGQRDGLHAHTTGSRARRPCGGRPRWWSRGHDRCRPKPPSGRPRGPQGGAAVRLLDGTRQAVPVSDDHDFDDLLAANRGYAESFTMQEFDGVAHAGVAMVTCMDSRIDPLRLIGLEPGDAKIFRNPGGRVTEAALEAIVLGVHLLGVNRVLVDPAYPLCGRLQHRGRAARARQPFRRPGRDVAGVPRRRRTRRQRCARTFARCARTR